MNIKAIQWQDALPIRHKVLWPDKQPSFCKVTGDETAKHYGVFINNELVSVASIYIEGRSARLRKFATLPELQSQGIGSQLITHIMDDLQAAGIERLWCDARTSAASFYQKFGLAQYGEVFFKSDVSYLKMEIRFLDQAGTT